MPEPFGIFMKRKREELGLTQLQLSEEANYARSYLAKIEASYKDPSDAVKEAVINVFAKYELKKNGGKKSGQKTRVRKTW